MAEEAAAAPAPAPAPVAAPAAELSRDDKLKAVLQGAVAVNGLRRGLREVTRAVDRSAAQLVVLASDCDHPEYVKLVKALSAARKVQLVEVASRKTLGEFCGLFKLDEEGNATNVVLTSSAAVTALPTEGRLAAFLQELKSA